MVVGIPKRRIMNELSTLNQLVTEIKFFENQAVTSYWEIGKRLSEAKEQVPHGEWEKWINSNLDYSLRTTRNLISIYQNNLNRQPVAEMSLRKQLALLTLEEDDREEVLKSHDVESMTTRELEKVVKEKKQLEQRLTELENQEPIIKEVIKEVIHPLYEKTKSQKDYLEIQLMKTESELNSLKQIAKNNQEDSEKYQKLKKDIEKLSTQKAEFTQQLQAIEHLAGLKTRLEQVFTTELLPINYHMDIRANAHSEQVLLSLEESVQVVEKWCSDMRKYLPNTTKGNYIDV